MCVLHSPPATVRAILLSSPALCSSLDMERWVVHYVTTTLAVCIIIGWVFVWFMHLLALFHGYATCLSPFSIAHSNQ